MITVLLALTAAALFALGTVLQQREAMREPEEGALGAGFLLRLARRPVWLAGMAADGLGFIGQAAALGVGRIVVVQPILATTVIFALPLGSRLSGQRIGRRDRSSGSSTNSSTTAATALGESAFLVSARTILSSTRRAVYLGDEALIDCLAFKLTGGAMKPVREAVRHVGREHSFGLLRESEASSELVGRLNEISSDWREGAAERGFTMELTLPVEGTEPDFLLALCLDREQRPVGFLRLLPCYGDDPGYSLDLMRRLPSAPNGLTEFLIANSALALGEHGFHRLSMNFAAWGRLFAQDRNLRPAERVGKALADLLNPFFQIESLRDFNQKFQPSWLPRSIVLEDAGQMARVGLLFASIEGFLDLPLVGKLLVPAPPAARTGEG